MISTRTKQINVYGKRPRRIIEAPPTEDFVYDQPSDSARPERVPLIHRMKKRENSSISTVAKPKPLSPPRAVPLTKQRVMSSWSPKRKDAKRGTRVAEILVQETAKLRVRDTGQEDPGDKKGILMTPSRKPLSTITTNAMNSPVPSGSKVATAKIHKKPVGPPKSLVTTKTLATIQMDIEVLNAKGQMLKQEKRVTRTDVVVNKTTAAPLAPPATKRHLSSRPTFAPSETIVIDSSVDEMEIPESESELLRAIVSNGSAAKNDSSLELRPVRRPRHTVARLVISDDSEDERDDVYLPPPDPLPTKPTQKTPAPPRRSVATAPQIATLQKPSLPWPSGLKVEVVVPPPRYKLPSKPTKTAIPAPTPQLPEKAAQKTHVRDTHTHTLSKLEAKPLPVSTSTISARPSQAHVRYPSYNLIPSPPLKPRSLTPIRNGRASASRFSFARAPPAPPSPTTPTDSEFDLSLDLSFDLGPEDLKALQVPEKQAKYLQPLLEECHQEQCGTFEFSAFIKTFPCDPILQDARDGAEKRNEEFRFRKIGEASYSEVFGIGDVVLKVIPLRDESRRRTIQEEEDGEEEDGPAPSDAKDVRKEIIVTRAMGEVHERFVKLLKTYVVRGKYPEVLLNLWDEYDERKGSESVRPDTFTASQMYVIIVLPNGGPDLEAYTFANPSKTGWKQACSLFWQVTKALAHAEQLVSFEHRDLHWGQILVKDLPSNKPTPLRSLAHTLNQTKPTTAQRVYMDDLAHGVEATIIDLGLSRMDAGDGDSGERVHWTPFDEEMFMGEGDYQFDIYRSMREHTSENWEAFHPLTNVMWLHYLATKLLRHKNLKPPSAPRKPRAVPPPSSQHHRQDAAFPHLNVPSSLHPTTQFTEKDCYDALVDIEDWLGRCIADMTPPPLKAKARGRPRKTAAIIKPIGGAAACACAGEVVGYGVKRGWIRAVS